MSKDLPKNLSKDLAELYKNSEQHSPIKFKLYKIISKFLNNEFLIDMFAETFTVVGRKKG